MLRRQQIPGFIQSTAFRLALGLSVVALIKSRHTPVTLCRFLLAGVERVRCARDINSHIRIGLALVFLRLRSCRRGTDEKISVGRCVVKKHLTIFRVDVRSHKFYSRDLRERANYNTTSQLTMMINDLCRGLPLTLSPQTRPNFVGVLVVGHLEVD